MNVIEIINKPALQEGERYLWYSKQMADLLYSEYHYNRLESKRTFYQTREGNIVETTTATTKPDHQTLWEDIVFVGVGKWHHNERP
jgi:hypothetical protein